MPRKIRAGSRRLRKWASKVTTGCQTCKARHVKCDETRPSCLRCRKAFFRCEGYGNEPEDNFVTQQEVQTSSNSPEPESSSSSLENSKLSSSPYESSSQLHGLRFYLDVTANMMNRSRIAPYVWKVLIPQFAWEFPCVRHALLASAEISYALFTREYSNGTQGSSEFQVLRSVNQSIRCLLDKRPVLDAVMLTCLLLGCVELFTGRWQNARMHIKHGFRLTENPEDGSTQNGFIPFYCRTFMKTLLDVGYYGNGDDTPDCGTVQLCGGIASLRDSLNLFDRALEKLDHQECPDKDRINLVIGYSKSEVEWLLPRWNQKLIDDCKKPMSWDTLSMARSEEQKSKSPWTPALEYLYQYIDEGKSFDMTKFEVGMERTMPLFALAKSGSNDLMREDVANLMSKSPALRKKED